MPQMMPLNWLILMLFFITLFILLLSFFHFIKLFNLKNNLSLPLMNMKMYSNQNKYSWMW